MLLMGIFGLIMLALGILSWLIFDQRLQAFGPVKNKIKTNKKIIALTFDDGPNEPYTSEILDILDSYNFKATFFVVGDNALKHPETIKKIISSGHEIGCHGQSHSFMKYIYEPTFFEELSKCKKTLNDLDVKNIKLVRTPWLMKNWAIFGGLKKAGFKFIVGGKYSSFFEPLGASPDYVFKSITKRLKKGDIIIFHDGHDAKGGDRTNTVAAVSRLAEFLKNSGYKSVSVSQLLEIEQVT
jgi:peptidoglycan/xylan/chitin deacetylase (PgdA/CDA1 family)